MLFCIPPALSVFADLLRLLGLSEVGVRGWGAGGAALTCRRRRHQRTGDRAASWDVVRGCSHGPQPAAQAQRNPDLSASDHRCQGVEAPGETVFPGGIGAGLVGRLRRTHTGTEIKPAGELRVSS